VVSNSAAGCLRVSQHEQAAATAQVSMSRAAAAAGKHTCTARQ
jgi:hypothetical protein